MEIIRESGSEAALAAQERFLKALVGLAEADTTAPVNRAFCKGAYQSYCELPAFTKAIDHYLTIESTSNTHYQINKSHKAIQEIIFGDIEGAATEYPEKATQSEWWIGIIATKFSDPDSPESHKLKSNLERPLQINRGYERAKIPALALTFPLHQRTREEDAYVHEYGAAAGLVLKALSNVTVAPTLILNEDGSIDQLSTIEFKALTYQPPRFAEGIGIEKFPPESEDDNRWIKGCTMDPDDDKFGTNEAIFDFLMATNAPDQPVTILKDDFLDLSPDSRAFLQSKKADVVNMSHVLPQNEGQIEETLDVVKTYSKPDATMLFTEYAKVDPDNPHNLKLLERWYKAPFSNTTFLYLPDEGFVPIIRWNTGHCSIGKLSEGITRLTNIFDV